MTQSDTFNALKRALFFFIVAASFSIYADTTIAEERSLFTTKLHGNLVAYFNGSRKPRVLKLSFFGPEGHYSYALTKASLGEAEKVLPTSQFLRGAPDPAKRYTASSNAALDVFEGTIRIFVLSKRTSRPLRIEAKMADLGLPGGVPAQVYLSPRVSEMGCGEHLLPSTAKANRTSSPAKLPTTASLTGLPAFTVSAKGDYDFFVSLKRKRESQSRTSQRVQHEMASILNSVNAIYINQLGLEVQATSFLVSTTSSKAFYSTNSESVLRKFRAQTIAGGLGGTADAFHLFSGIKYDDSVVGLAYVGALCQGGASTFAYGLTGKASSSIKAFVTAHELGHNLNASHINKTNSIMSTILTPRNNTFVAESVAEINEYIGQFGTCVDS